MLIAVNSSSIEASFRDCTQSTEKQLLNPILSIISDKPITVDSASPRYTSQGVYTYDDDAMNTLRQSYGVGSVRPVIVL